MINSNSISDQEVRNDTSLTTNNDSSHFNELSENNPFMCQYFNSDISIKNGYITPMHSLVTKQVFDTISDGNFKDFSNPLLLENARKTFIDSLELDGTSLNTQNGNLNASSFQDQNIMKIPGYFSNNNGASPLWSTESTASDDSSQLPYQIIDLPPSNFKTPVDSPEQQDYSYLQQNHYWADTVNGMSLNLDASDTISSNSNHLFDIDLIDKMNPLHLHHNATNVMDNMDSQITLETLINEYINADAIGSLNNSHSASLTSNSFVDKLVESGSNSDDNKNIKKLSLQPPSEIPAASKTTPLIDVKPKKADLKAQASNGNSSDSLIGFRPALKSIQPSTTSTKKAPRPVFSKPYAGGDNKSVAALTSAPTQKSRSKPVRKINANIINASTDKPAKKVKIESEKGAPILSNTNKIEPVPLTTQQSHLISHPRFTSILPRAGFSTASTLQPPTPNINSASSFNSKVIERLPKDSSKKPEIMHAMENKPFIHPISIQSSVSMSSASIQKSNNLVKQQVTPDQVAAKRQERLIKNRAAALQSRKKRREHMDFLEKKVADLESENNNLKSQINTKESLLQKVQKQLNDLMLEKSSRVKLDNVKSEDSKEQNAAVAPNSLTLNLAKSKSSHSRNHSTHAGNFFDSSNAKQNLVNSVLMAVLFSFTLLCIPNAIEPCISHLGSNSHDLPFQIYNEVSFQSPIPSSNFEPEINKIVLGRDQSFSENIASTPQKVESIYKSIVSLTTKLASSIYLPILLSKDFPITKQGEASGSDNSPSLSLTEDDLSSEASPELDTAAGLKKRDTAFKKEPSSQKLVSGINTSIHPNDNTLSRFIMVSQDIQMPDIAEQSPNGVLDLSDSSDHGKQYMSHSSPPALASPGLILVKMEIDENS